MKKPHLINKLLVGSWVMLAMTLANAGNPLWTFTPLTSTSHTVAANGVVTVKYKVTNQSRRPHTLVMKAIPGISQVTTTGNCSSPFVLGYKQSCTLNLAIHGQALRGSVESGPIVCEKNSSIQCYQPARINSLKIRKTVAGTISTTPPANQTIDSGQTATFSTTASHGASPYRYQWQVNTGNGFTDVSSGTGATSASYTTAALTTTANGYTYRVKVTDAYGVSVISNPATLRVYRYAYVANWGDDSISLCNIDAETAELTNCDIAATGINSPNSIVLNQAKTRAYVPSWTNDTVSICDINSMTGAITNCAATGGPFNTPTDIALNKEETMAYVTNLGIPKGVSICQVNADTGTISECNMMTSASMNEPQSISLNGEGTLAYIANWFNNPSRVLICSVTPGTGALADCTGAGDFDRLNKLVLNSSETLAYLLNYNGGELTLCNVTPVTGALTGCVPTGSGFDRPYRMTFNAAETLAYITNASGDDVSLCNVTPTTGVLTGCLSTGSGFNVPSGIALT